MKKIVFFIPAIILALFYGWIAIAGIAFSISPVLIGWLALLIVAGILLSKAVFWGSLFGMLPAVDFIYMSTQETGQAVNAELPAGIIFLLFYLVCGYFVYKGRISK